MRRIPHDSVYTDRLSERALCYDFPADKAFIDGLHAMQSYFVARGSNIDIPVVRVMNTAHWLVAYLYATSCSGEQLEYDAMTYNSVGRDKQLMYVSLIVLIAMLNRTEGARAKACRSMMLENRPEDFYEGVSLYEQWLDGGLEHYTDEDFLIDIMDEVNLLKQENQRLTYENQQLKTRISMTNNINNFGVINIYETQNPQQQEKTQLVEDITPVETPSSAKLFCRITKHAIETGHAQEVEDALRSASVSAPKLVKAIKTNEALGYLDTQNLTSQALYDMLNEHFGLAFKYRQFVAERSK